MRNDRVGEGRQTPRVRRGLSIVEVLVALMVLTVGLLGVAGASARSIKVGVAAVRERRATQRAADRVATLASQGCSRARSGSLVDSVAGMTERWTLTMPGAGVALIDADVQWAASGRTRSITLRSAMLC